MEALKMGSVILADSLGVLAIIFGIIALLV